MIIISVVKSKRGMSKMEFVQNARNLELFTMKRCVNFPKKYTFHIGNKISTMAFEIYNNVLLANNIYPSNQHEAQIRNDHLVEARGLLYSMVAQIEIACELFSISGNTMEEWMELISSEISLINGVIKNDKKKFRL